MKVRFFGTGSATPHLERHSSACLVELHDKSVLIDCGEGTQYRLLQEKVKQSRISIICITHLHGDHYFGLVGLLSSWSLSQRASPLTIYGPSGLKEIIEIQLMSDGAKLNFDINFVETSTAAANILLASNSLSITSVPLVHRVPCTGFVIKQLNPKRKVVRTSIPANFPLPFLKMFQNGESVTDELTGKYYDYQDYTVPGDPPKSFAYCSDTAFNPSMVFSIKDVDILYHESTFGEEHAPRAAKTMHSTAKQAAFIAKEANVKRLLLGHFSSRYKSLDFLKEEALEVFSDVELIEQFKVYEV